MSVCSSSSSSSSGGYLGSAKAWIVHGIVAGITIGAAIGARAYLGRSRKFRSRVVGIIPARFASSRFQGKPLVEILGKPMIQVSSIDYHSQLYCSCCFWICQVRFIPLEIFICFISDLGFVRFNFIVDVKAMLYAVDLP